MKRSWLFLMILLWAGFPAEAQQGTPLPDGALFIFTSEKHDFEIFFPDSERLHDCQPFVTC